MEVGQTLNQRYTLTAAIGAALGNLSELPYNM